MSLTQIFQEKIPEIYDFINTNYGFEFEVINEYRIVARKEDINLSSFLIGECFLVWKSM